MEGREWREWRGVRESEREGGREKRGERVEGGLVPGLNDFRATSKNINTSTFPTST